MQHQGDLVAVSPTMTAEDLKKWLISGLNLSSSHIHYPVNETAIISDFDSSVKDAVSTGKIWIWLVVFILSLIVLRWVCIFIGRCCCCFFCCRRTGYQPISAPAPSLIPILKVENRSRGQRSSVLPFSVAIVPMQGPSSHQKQQPPTPPHFASPIHGISKVTEKRLAQKGEIQLPKEAKEPSWRR
jgi:hypothetical protein